jgi:hypothetical protein
MAASLFWFLADDIARRVTPPDRHRRIEHIAKSERRFLRRAQREPDLGVRLIDLVLDIPAVERSGLHVERRLFEMGARERTLSHIVLPGSPILQVRGAPQAACRTSISRVCGPTARDVREQRALRILVDTKDLCRRALLRPQMTRRGCCGARANRDGARCQEPNARTTLAGAIRRNARGRRRGGARHVFRVPNWRSQRFLVLTRHRKAPLRSEDRYALAATGRPRAVRELPIAFDH